MAPGPDVCSRATCRRPRPSRGWPGFLDFGHVIDERYEVQRILGAGGAGVTYRCVDHIDDEVAAVKVLHADRKRGTLANRLAIEGEVLEILDHPHIVPFRELRLHGEGPYYLATLHMAGGSLDGWIRRHGPMSPQGAITVGRQLGMALDYVHAGGIVHRDLKPANVLLEEGDGDNPVVRLADFGIARLFREQQPVAGLTRTGAFIGTPEYAAPEQVRGEKGIGPAADAFALGALLHFVASGEALYRREDIHDWKAFRERRWNAADRPRLTDVVDCDRPEDRRTLALMDEVIDALMHPDPALRLDMATAAMRLGANPAQLAPVDQPAFSPPSLVSSTHDGLGDELEALVPIDEDAITASDPPALLGPADSKAATLDLGMRSSQPDLPAVAGSSPAVAGPSPARERRPIDTAVLDDVPVPTRDASEDWTDDDLAWPTREVRRDRLHGALALASALMLGLVLAWPGGPGRLIGEDRLAALGAPFDGIGQRLSVEETSYLAQDAATPPVTVEQEPAERAEAPTDEPRTTRTSTPTRRPSTRQDPNRSTERQVATRAAPTASERPTATRAEPATTDRADERPPESTPAEPRPKVEPTDEAPAPSRAEPRVVRVALRSPDGELKVTGRVELPASPELPVLSPVDFPEAALDALSAVDAWAADPDDSRDLAEVLEQETAREAQRMRDEVRRQALSLIEADERAERYAEDAAVDEARLARKQARWERAQEGARQTADEEAERSTGDESADAWEAQDEADLLDALFGRDPRVAPRD